jgi:D-xylonolactonase
MTRCLEELVPTPITETSCVIGENPLWHAEQQKLYWCDIPLGRLYRYDPVRRSTEIVRDGSSDKSVIGGFTIEADGSLLLFMGGGRVVRWDWGLETVIVDGVQADAEYRYNDVIADPAGRVFCGTYRYADYSGALYRMEATGARSCVVKGVGCSNGMAFSNDRKRIYHTDSIKRTISAFDYDESTGVLVNGRVLIRTRAEDGVPDGLTVDAEDHLWSAQWDGSCVIRYTPDGLETGRVSLPVKQPSSVAFGGSDMRTLFITTAGGDNPHANGAGAGSLFSVQTGITGSAEFLSRITLFTANDKPR